MLVYDGAFADRSIYEKTTMQGIEMGAPFRAVWLDLKDVGPGKPPLYPSGLAELLHESRHEKSPA